jgi:RNA polymerase sigma-70 factor (ECF subfamily)
MGTPTEEAQWALRAQCGDREALELLLRSLSRPVLRYLQRLVGPADADDLLQDVLLAVARKMYWLAEPELLRPWVFRIASRAAFKHLKRQRRWPSDDAGMDAVAAPEPPAGQELLAALATMEGISPASRAVLVLHFQEELSLIDVAAILELPVGTVKSRLAYGLKALRAQLTERGRL